MRFLSDAAAAQSGGATLMAALKALDVSYNTYNNWMKKAGPPLSAPDAKHPKAKAAAQKADAKTGAAKAAAKAVAPKTKGPNAKAKEAAGKKAQTKSAATGKKKGRARNTTERMEAMRQKEQALKAEGKTVAEIANILGVSIGTLYNMRKAVKALDAKPQVHPATTQQIHLSPGNPMYQLALTHERLMAVNKQIETLTAERDKLASEMQAMMAKAVEICPGLMGKK